MDPVVNAISDSINWFYGLPSAFFDLKRVPDPIPLGGHSYSNQSKLVKETSGCCRSKAVTPAAGPLFDMSTLTRLAGLSGALAIGFSAYGAHVLNQAEINENRKRVFETGNKNHIVHSFALLMAHRSNYPKLTGALFGLGLILFCGPCYHYSIWNDERFRKYTPLGGILFMLGWLSFVL